MMEAGGCRAPVFESRGAVALWRLLVRRRFGRLAKECAFPFTWHLVPRLVHRAWPWHSGARSWSLTPAHCAFTYKHSGSAATKLRHRHIILRAARCSLPTATARTPPTTALRQPQQLPLQPTPRAPHHPDTSHNHGGCRHGRRAPGEDQDRQGQCCRGRQETFRGQEGQHHTTEDRT